MKNIKVVVDLSLLTEKVITKKESGETFTLTGVLLGSKFVRVFVEKGKELPKVAIMGHLGVRTYETQYGEKEEIVIWVDNAVAEVKQAVAVATIDETF